MYDCMYAYCHVYVYTVCVIVYVECVFMRFVCVYMYVYSVYKYFTHCRIMCMCSVYTVYTYAMLIPTHSLIQTHISFS